MRTTLIAVLVFFIMSCSEDPAEEPPTTMCASWSTDEFRNAEEFACVTPDDIDIIRDTSDFIAVFRTWVCDDCR